MSTRALAVNRLETTSLPEDVVAENLVLGSILASTDTECFARVAEILTEAAFSVERNRVIFGAMRKIFDRGLAINFGTLRSELERVGFFRQVGAKISHLMDGMPELHDVESICAVVAEKYRLRVLIQTLDDATRRAISLESSEEIVLDTQKKLVGIEQTLASEDGTDAGKIFEEAGGINGFLSPATKPGIMSPWPRLNRCTSGFKPGEIYILGGRPGTGKTSKALQIAAQAMFNGHRVAFASYEMTPRALMHRMVCSHARVDSRRAMNGTLTEEERYALNVSAQQFDEYREFLQILDPKKKTVTALTSYARKQKILGRPVELFIVDYLQRMKGIGKFETRALEVASISGGLADMTKDHDAAVLALSQLKRDFDTGGRDKQPEMSDVAESGGIERDADFMGILKLRDAEQLTKPVRDVDLYIVKQRNGPTGKIQFKFETVFCAFQEEPENRREEMAA